MVDDLVVVNDLSNTHEGSCSICGMAMWIKQERIDTGDGRGMRHVTCAIKDRYESEIKTLKDSNKKLHDTLTWVLHDVQEWCECVDNDSSWDSWDSYYKSFQYGGLEEAREALK